MLIKREVSSEYNLKVDPNSVLLKHRRFIKDLEEKKFQEKEVKNYVEYEQDEKFKKFRD